MPPLFGLMPLIQSLLDGIDEHPKGERFGQRQISPQPACKAKVEGGIDATAARDGDDSYLGVVPEQVGERLYTLDLRHDDVRDDQVEIQPRIAVEDIAAVADRRDFMFGIGQRPAHHFQ